MKIGIVYTGTSPELMDSVETELRNAMRDDLEFVIFKDVSIINEVSVAKDVFPAPAARLVKLYTDAIAADVDVIYNCCSSVGEVADNMQDFAKYIGVPIIRIDEEMCLEAARNAKKIGVMATLSSTLEPTKRTIQRKAREINKRVELLDCVVDVFGLEPEVLKKNLVEAGTKIKDHVDIIVLAQGSMAFCEQAIHEACGIPVYSSPRFGASALKSALQSKGVL